MIVLSESKEVLDLLEQLGINTKEIYEVNIHICAGEAVTITTKTYVDEENLRNLKTLENKYHLNKIQ